LRAGVGLVTIASDDPEVSAQLVAHRPELMVRRRGDETLLPGASALCVGPGLTRAADRLGLAELWRVEPRPAVFDASALDEVPLLEPNPHPKTELPHRRGARVITPHPGEAARLLTRAFPDDPWSSVRVQAHRVEAVRRLAGCTGAVVVLKGEGTLVATPAMATTGTGENTGEITGENTGENTGEAAHVHVVVSGSAALATAGSGDVLAGVLGALMARGVTAAVAAPIAAHVHGLAGERLEVGAAAMDVADAVAHAMADVQTAAGRQHSRWPTLRRG
ncbi:MAG: NAD(P)H-hydrate dehydratase, partial [Nannocystaceae bacterium]|nr:NAD(P)H-hydrate dehydratase [Nannocystaceae bacterium]